MLLDIVIQRDALVVISKSYKRFSDEFIESSLGLITFDRDVLFINKNSKRSLSDL